MAEAGLYPGMLWQLTFWYRPDEIAVRMTVLGVLGQFSGILDSLLTYGICEFASDSLNAHDQADLYQLISMGEVVWMDGDGHSLLLDSSVSLRVSSSGSGIPIFPIRHRVAANSLLPRKVLSLLLDSLQTRLDHRIAISTGQPSGANSNHRCCGDSPSPKCAPTAPSTDYPSGCQLSSLHLG